MPNISVVIPNWNGEDSLADCLDSLAHQSIKSSIIVVDNGSIDGSLKLLEKYKNIELIKHSKNLGFAGGVNSGFRKAIENKSDYVAAFNNDAIADKNWMRSLADILEKKPDVGIVTSKLLSQEQYLDSTGDYYTVWGLPYPRGRGERDLNKYDSQIDIFAASGGASLYRVSMLQEIGLFDEDFFAYYEDVDLSFRAQLAGWKVCYQPKSIAYHQIGATSSKIKGFTTYQTMKNLPLLLIKNVPSRYLYKVLWRFSIAQNLFFLRAVFRGQGLIALKGSYRGCILFLFNGLKKRKAIQSSKKVSDKYIWTIIVHDLPPNARSLRRLRNIWWKLTLR